MDLFPTKLDLKNSPALRLKISTKFPHRKQRHEFGIIILILKIKLTAQNPRRKGPGAGRRVKVEAEGIPRHDLDATTGDLQWQPDLRGEMNDIRCR
jgi:hypothetical protein